MSKKCTPLWREAHFKVKSAKKWGIRSTFGRSDAVLRGRQKDFAPCQKWAKREGFYSSFKNDGRRGTFEEGLDRWISRGRRNTRDTWVRCVRRSGWRFPERGCMLEHEISSFAKMILRDRRSTSHDLASLSRGRRNTLETWSRKIAKRSGTRPSALHSIFHYWRKSRRIVWFLMLPTSKLEEVSQMFFVFDVIKFKRLASFLPLSSSKIEEVWQNSFVVKLACRQIDR